MHDPLWRSGILQQDSFRPEGPRLVFSTLTRAWLLVLLVYTLRSQLAWAFAIAKGECSKTCHSLLGLLATALGGSVRGASGAPFIVTLPFGFDSKTNTPLSDLHLIAAAAARQGSAEATTAPQHRNIRRSRGCRFAWGAEVNQRPPPCAKAAPRPTPSHIYDCLLTIPS
jgi:hypothetical protein